MTLRASPPARFAAADLLLVVAAAAAAPGEEHSPTVIMVSCDGFRYDHADLTETPTLDRLAGGGVHAEALVPPFPAETFPGR
jgi:predicted AlkP superfamily pyrophosphatase or phosphodiesterase